MRAVNEGLGGKPAPRTRRAPSRTRAAAPKRATAARSATKPTARRKTADDVPKRVEHLFPTITEQRKANRAAIRRATVSFDKFNRPTRGDAAMVREFGINPAGLERKLATAARRKFPRDTDRQRRYVYGTLNRLGLLRRNPTGIPALLRKARRASANFHGEQGEVYKLDATERRAPPPVVVALGEVTAIEYKAPGRSQRNGGVWRHATGDRGDNAPRARRRPLLVADPVTGRPYIVPNGSPQKFSSRRGLVG